ncbi:hypothetical protein Tco_0133783 [Tanacetum coccineum]
MVYVVNGVLASDVDMFLEKDFVGFTLQDMKIHPLMLLIRTLSMILQTFSPTLHNPSTNHTRVNYVETTLIMVMIVHHGYRFLRDVSILFLLTMITIPLNEIVSQIPPSIAITTVLPILGPVDSSSWGLRNISTILEMEYDKEKSLTFSNPLFDSNDDFTSSDDESLSDEDVLKDNVKIYSNPLFKLDDEYISSDVNPLFDEVLEDIENKDPYNSDLDEPALLVTPLSDFNEDECFDPGGDVDEIEFLLHRNTSTPKISIASILEGFTNEPPLEENDDLFDFESKENELKKILYDAPIE